MGAFYIALQFILILLGVFLSEISIYILANFSDPEVTGSHIAQALFWFVSGLLTYNTGYNEIRSIWNNATKESK